MSVSDSDIKRIDKLVEEYLTCEYARALQEAVSEDRDRENCAYLTITLAGHRDVDIDLSSVWWEDFSGSLMLVVPKGVPSFTLHIAASSVSSEVQRTKLQFAERNKLDDHDAIWGDNWVDPLWKLSRVFSIQKVHIRWGNDMDPYALQNNFVQYVDPSFVAGDLMCEAAKVPGHRTPLERLAAPVKENAMITIDGDAQAEVKRFLAERTMHTQTIEADPKRVGVTIYSAGSAVLTGGSASSAAANPWAAPVRERVLHHVGARLAPEEHASASAASAAAAKP